MPFGGWFDSYYEEIYVPAIETCSLVPHRADDLYRPSTITQDIWAYTKKAHIVLADLTGKNPNVFYELGLAHALAKPAILVTESLDDVPFDLRALRVIEYNRHSPDWGSILHDKIKKSIKEVLAAPAEAVLPTFLNVKGGTEKPTVSPTEKQLIEVRQELDLLRRELRSRDDEQRLAIENRARIVSQPSGNPIDDLKHHIKNGAPQSWLERHRIQWGVSEGIYRQILHDTMREMSVGRRVRLIPSQAVKSGKASDSKSRKAKTKN